MKSADSSKLEIDAAIEALNKLKLEKASIERQLQGLLVAARAHSIEKRSIKRW
jgi:hypothetical protein